MLRSLPFCSVRIHSPEVAQLLNEFPVKVDTGHIDSFWHQYHSLCMRRIILTESSQSKRTSLDMFHHDDHLSAQSSLLPSPLSLYLAVIPVHVLPPPSRPWPEPSFCQHYLSSNHSHSFNTPILSPFKCRPLTTPTPPSLTQATG